MLNLQQITIGKLKHAYGLTVQDTDNLLGVLWPNDVFPYLLWEKAYESFWKEAAAHNTIFHLVGVISPLPEVDPQEYAKTPLYPYQEKIVPFFVELSRKLFAADFLAGLRYIVGETYDGSDHEFKESVEYIADRLAEAEDDFNLKIYPPHLWATNLSSERFKQMVEAKILSVPLPFCLFLSKMFTDTIVVDKSAAISFLSSYGYPFRQEVKGITRNIVDSIIKKTPATADIQPSGQDPFSIPRSLWEGKTKEFICAALREKGLSNEEIAHVLFHKRGFTQKRAIGKLLHDNPNLTDSAYDKYGKQLFEDSKLISIGDGDAF